VEDRESMMAHLGKAGIGTGVHYPIPLHRQRAYEDLGYEAGDFPVTEKVAGRIVSLPMFPNLSAEQQGRVVNEVARFPQTAASKYSLAIPLDREELQTPPLRKR
jgi:dTDP-4-amino-4,6-dideoxygalactose transaminase